MGLVLLASLLPCVYPLYPVTASIIQGRSQGDMPRALHPVCYYTGLAMIYFLFGWIAAITGGAFNEVLRLSVTNLLLALLFLVLALATAGYIHMRVLAATELETKPQGYPARF